MLSPSLSPFPAKSSILSPLASPFRKNEDIVPGAAGELIDAGTAVDLSCAVSAPAQLSLTPILQVSPHSRRAGSFSYIVLKPPRNSRYHRRARSPSSR